jgi:hypothetical protein
MALTQASLSAGHQILTLDIVKAALEIGQTIERQVALQGL